MSEMLLSETRVTSEVDELLREAEAFGSGFAVLTEAKDKKKEAPEGTLGFIEGVGGKAGIVNRNLRFYSKAVYENAVKNANPLVEQGRFLMEVDHPDWRGSLKNASVRITELFMDGDLMKFEGVILDTEPGRHLKGLMKGGVGVAVSTRGYGSAKVEKMKVNGQEMEVAVIQDDFRLEGIDIVLFPSNVYGSVKAEHAINSTQESITVTLEQLRQEHPELVADIEAAAREGFISQADHETAVSEATNTAKEEGAREVREGEELNSLKALLTTVIEAITPHVPELKAAAEARANAEDDAEKSALESQVEALTARLEAIESEKKNLEDAARKDELTQAIAAEVEKVLEGNKHAELLRPELLKCESVEAVAPAFEAENAKLVRLEAAIQVGEQADEKGAGHADIEKPKSDEALSEEEKVKANERRLAGLPVKK